MRGEVPFPLGIVANGLPHNVLLLDLELLSDECLLKDVSYFFLTVTVGGIEHPSQLAKDNALDKAALASAVASLI